MPLAIKYIADNTYLQYDGSKGTQNVKTFEMHHAREAERAANQSAHANEQWTVVEYSRPEPGA